MSISNRHPRLQRGFGVVAKAVIRNKSIRGPARLLYALLATYADDEGVCYPSNETLAEDLGATPKSVQNWMGELVEAGVIERVPRFVEGRQTASLTRLIDTLVSQGDVQPFPPGDVQPFPPGGEPPFVQNKTSSNKTTKNKDALRDGGNAGSRSWRRGASSPAPQSMPLTPDMLTWAADKGVTDVSWLESKTEEFLNWARSVDRRYVDWTAAWQNSIKRDIDRGGPPARSSEPPAPYIPHVSEIEQPPNGLSDEEMSLWLRRQRERAGA